MTAARQKKRSPAATGQFAEESRDNALDFGSASRRRQSIYMPMNDAIELNALLASRVGVRNAPLMTSFLFHPGRLCRFTGRHGHATCWAIGFLPLDGAAFGDTLTGEVECFIFESPDGSKIPEPSRELRAMAHFLAKVVKERDLATGVLPKEELIQFLATAGHLPLTHTKGHQ